MPYTHIYTQANTHTSIHSQPRQNDLSTQRCGRTVAWASLLTLLTLFFDHTNDFVYFFPVPESLRYWTGGRSLSLCRHLTQSLSLWQFPTACQFRGLATENKRVICWLWCWVSFRTWGWAWAVWADACRSLQADTIAACLLTAITKPGFCLRFVQSELQPTSGFFFVVL